MKQPLNIQMLGTAFLSGKNIALVYAQVHSILRTNYDMDIGTFYTGDVADCMRWFWSKVQSQITAEHLEAPKQTIIQLNKAALQRIAEGLVSENRSGETSNQKPRRAPEPLPLPLDPSPAVERVPLPETVTHKITMATKISDLVYDPETEEEEETRDFDIPLTRCTPINSLVPLQDEAIESETTSVVRPASFTTVLVRSEQRDVSLYPDAHTYSIPFCKKNVVGIVFAQIDLTLNRFQITPLTCNLYFAEDDDPMKSITVETGNWSIEDVLQKLQHEMSKAGRYRYVWSLDEKTAKVSIRQLSNGFPGQLHLLFEQTKNHLGGVLGFGRQDCRGASSYTAQSPFSLSSSDSLVVWCAEFSSDPIAILDVSAAKRSPHPMAVTERPNKLIFDSESPAEFENVTFRFEHVDGKPFHFCGGEHVMVFNVFSQPDRRRDGIWRDHVEDEVGEDEFT